MKQKSKRTIEIPSGISFSASKDSVTVSSSGKELKRKIDFGKIEAVIVDGKIVVSSKTDSKREIKMVGTITAHLKNMIKGIKEDFVYKLEICNVHFPMNVKVEGDQVIIKSFLGEKHPRHSKISPNTKVEIKGSEITVSSPDIESAGQTATNLEKATRLTGRDRRVFQDGIFITTKNGKKI